MAKQTAVAADGGAAAAPRTGGLEGIFAATTAIDHVDGEAGRLIYRGYDIHDLVYSTTFEEVAYLLWFGHLPTPGELDRLRADLLAQRQLSAPMLAFLRTLPPDTAPMDVLRTAVSFGREPVAASYPGPDLVSGRRRRSARSFCSTVGTNEGRVTGS